MILLLNGKLHKYFSQPRNSLYSETSVVTGLMHTCIRARISTWYEIFLVLRVKMLAHFQRESDWKLQTNTFCVFVPKTRYKLVRVVQMYSGPHSQLVKFGQTDLEVPNFCWGGHLHGSITGVHYWNRKCLQNGDRGRKKNSKAIPHPRGYRPGCIVRNPWILILDLKYLQLAQDEYFTSTFTK